MLGFGERKSGNSASEDWFPPLLACASRIASQAKGTTFLTGHVVPMFAHIIVVFSLTESQHLHFIWHDHLLNKNTPEFKYAHRWIKCQEKKVQSTLGNSPILLMNEPSTVEYCGIISFTLAAKLA
jgi:hypothetical protein